MARPATEKKKAEPKKPKLIRVSHAEVMAFRRASKLRR